jgi:hypothetical protein
MNANDFPNGLPWYTLESMLLEAKDPTALRKEIADAGIEIVGAPKIDMDALGGSTEE